MDTNFRFKININLQNFATIAVAVNLWEQVDIKKRVDHLFKTADHSKHEFHTSKENKQWNKIVNQVAENSTLLHLPEDVIDKIKILAEPIGDHIFYWNVFLFHNLNMPLEYAQKIFWTPYGTIDENRIFHLYWKKMKDFQDPSQNHVIFVSCLFAQESFIRQNIRQIRSKTESYLSSVTAIKCGEASKFNSYAIIVIWLCIYFNKTKTDAVKFYKKLKQSNNLASELFLKCLHDGFGNAAKYLWKKLTEEEKQRSQLAGFKNCIERWINRNSYEEEKCLEMIYFMINNMDDNERFTFICADDNIERIFQYSINIWPYQNIIEPMIDFFIDHLKPDQLEYFFLFCLNHLTNGFFGRRFINKDVTQRVLCKVFPKIPKELKLRGAFSIDQFLELSFKLLEIPVLSLFLIDKDLSDHKEKILKLGDSKFKELIRSNDFELLNKFTENAFLSESERKKFKLRLNIAQDLVNEGNLDLADKLINWIADSDEEKFLLKKEINFLRVCENSKSFKSEMLDEFLLWQCNTEEEKKIMKQSMKNSEFICDKIIKIWNENDQVDESQCFQFLKWLAESEEEAIELKNNLLIDEKFVQKFCDTLPLFQSYKRIVPLFEFLSVSPETILEIKEKIIRNLEGWLFRYVATQKNYKLAEVIVENLFIDENQKKKELAKLFSSQKGTVLIFKTIMSCSKEYIPGILFLLNNLVKSYGDASKLREKSGSVKVKTIRELSAFQILINVLDILKEGGTITENDITSHEIITNMDF